MEIIKINKAPQAIGHYSQAVKAGGFVFLSGQIALCPDGKFLNGDIKEQTTQVLENLKAVLEASGSGLSNVIKTTVYLVDINDFASFNEVYGLYFSGDKKPARATVEVKGLPKGARVEIDCIATHGAKRNA